MKKTILTAAYCIFGLCVFSTPIYAQGGWVNYEGCYCGGYPYPPVSFVSKGSGAYSERSATLSQMNYWDKYADIFNGSTGYGLGSPHNGVNEVNTFITAAEAWSRYGITNFGPTTYGYTVIIPEANFGSFNDCRYFSSAGCGPFTETDILMNANFSGGWTTDPKDFSRALIQATALHELGHAWGAHHVFDLTGHAANAFSTMNYASDSVLKYVARMDANTIRSAYAGRAQAITDVGIFPFTYGQGKDAQTYTAASSSVAVGSHLSIGPFIIQNLGTTTASNVVITFYLSQDTTLDDDDCSIGTATYSSLSRDTEYWVSGTSLPIPTSTGNGYYYIGARVSVNGSDAVTENNSFMLLNGAGAGFRQVQVWGSSIPYPTDCACVSWCGDNYVELDVNPTSMFSGGQHTLSWDCSFSDVNYYGDPVNVFMALIRDPVVTNGPSTVNEALSGEAVYLFYRGFSNSYRYRGKLLGPTWKGVAFPPLPTSGAFLMTLTAPPGEYVWATAFVDAATGAFIRTDQPVENSNSFTIW
jgi:hypothetical protein